MGQGIFDQQRHLADRMQKSFAEVSPGFRVPGS
jgi:hypothetical protein